MICTRTVTHICLTVYMRETLFPGYEGRRRGVCHHGGGGPGTARQRAKN